MKKIILETMTTRYKVASFSSVHFKPHPWEAENTGGGYIDGGYSRNADCY